MNSTLKALVVWTFALITCVYSAQADAPQHLNFNDDEALIIVIIK